MELLLTRSETPVVLNPTAILVLLVLFSLLIWLIVEEYVVIFYPLAAGGVALVVIFILWLLSQDVTAWTKSLRFYMLVCTIMWLPTMLFALHISLDTDSTDRSLSYLSIIASIIGTVCCVLCIKWIIAPW